MGAATRSPTGGSTQGVGLACQVPQVEQGPWPRSSPHVDSSAAVVGCPVWGDPRILSVGLWPLLWSPVGSRRGEQEPSLGSSGPRGLRRFGAAWFQVGRWTCVVSCWLWGPRLAGALALLLRETLLMVPAVPALSSLFL